MSSKKKQHTREPIAFVHPKGDHDAFAKKLADKVADEVIRQANAERARQGKPPLKK